jgi:hypothetical protein
MGNLQRPAKAFKEGLPKVRDQEIGGSNPLAPTISFWKSWLTEVVNAFMLMGGRPFKAS